MTVSSFARLVFDGGCKACMFHQEHGALCRLDGEAADMMEQCHCLRLRRMAWICQQDEEVSDARSMLREEG